MRKKKIQEREHEKEEYEKEEHEKEEHEREEEESYERKNVYGKTSETHLAIFHCLISSHTYLLCEQNKNKKNVIK